MRFVWAALLGGALFGGGVRATTLAAPALHLQECRLEHPLRLSSMPARCGVLEVPEDPANSTVTIGLHVAVVAAVNRQSSGAPLFILAGGPGQAASDLYTTYAGAFARVNRNHAIVLVDQRGTGRSAPLTCPHPDDWRENPGDMAEVRRSIQGCLAKFGARVRFYTTSVAVTDLESVRRALGLARIELYGSSYGTRVAELYMRRYPEATQAVVLDGVTYPEQSIGAQTPLDGERALRLIVARCAATTECARAFPTLQQDLTELRQRFGPERRPLDLADPVTGLPMSVEFNRGLLNAALRILSYSTTEASLLPTLLHEAAIGHYAPLAAQVIMLSRQIDAQLASGMQNTVICSEDAPGFALSADERERIAATYQGMDQLDVLGEICKIWPHGPVDPDLHAALQSEVPTLLLSGEADPVTPPQDAVRAAAGLRHHRLLVLKGEGHGQLATGCMPKLLAEFLDNPIPETLSADCLERHRPAPFFLSLTGPAP